MQRLIFKGQGYLVLGDWIVRVKSLESPPPAVFADAILGAERLKYHITAQAFSRSALVFREVDDGARIVFAIIGAHLGPLAQSDIAKPARWRALVASAPGVPTSPARQRANPLGRGTIFRDRRRG